MCFLEKNHIRFAAYSAKLPSDSHPYIAPKFMTLAISVYAANQSVAKVSAIRLEDWQYVSEISPYIPDSHTFS